MRNSIRLLSILLALVLLCGCSRQQPVSATVPTTEPADTLVVTVNGEEIRSSEFETYRQQYLRDYTIAGIDPTDPESVAFIEDAALTACIQDLLLEQDIRAQGCYEFDEETAAWMESAGTAAYENALLDVAEYLRSTLDVNGDADLSEAAKAYAEGAGVSEKDYIDVYRAQYAYTTYCNWLTEDCPVTDADIEEAYNSRVSADAERFATDAVAYETAIAADEAVWYQPAGYRSILQILLKATGETEEEKLASVQDVIDNIYARLEAGEDFAALIAEFGSDANFANEQFLSTGYSVHRDSVVWDSAFIDAAFGDGMNASGCWSTKPLVSDAGVHILYYLKDSEGGPVALTESIREALSYTLYQERVNDRMAKRLEVLSDTAEVVYPE